VHYYIIGTDHKYQRKDAGLRAVMEAVVGDVKNHCVVLIAEEVNSNVPDYQQKSVGRDIAGNSIPWLPIDMTLQEQRDKGIFDDLENAVKLRNEEGRNVYYAHANTVREKHWLRKIRRACQGRAIKDGTILITCGRNRLEFLAEKLIRFGASSVYTTEYPVGIKQAWPPLELLP
jgi:hypothetical protein